MRKITPAVAILAIYAIVIIGSVVYFVALQNFGSSGLEVHISGRDRQINLLDFMILIIMPIAFVLFIISLLAYMRKRDTRMLVISAAFFFFMVKETLFALENFFPNEFIFIANAERALELLILLSFVFLMYRK